jgi:uncharacterized protein YfaS (alpha-2-macroglobulin family)
VFSMQKGLTLSFMAGLLCITGCVGTMDRILLVKGEVTRSPEQQCSVQFIDSIGNVLHQDQMTASGRAGFLNPPRYGQFFILIHCTESSVTYRKGPYLFERDYVVDFGKITNSQQ